LHGTMAQSRVKHYGLLMSIVFIGYLIFGVSENVKGPALPRMQDDFGIGEWEIGLLLAFNSIGFLLASSFAGAIVQAVGLRASLIVTFVCMAVSGWMMGASNSFATFAASFFFLYVWNGLLEIALALLSARIFTKNTGMMMNLSHFFYGLSSTVAPLAATALMAWSIGGGEPLGWRGMYAIMLALSILPAIPAIVAKFPSEAGDSGTERTTWRSFAKERAAWYIVVMLAFGVTAELAAAAWLVNFLEKVHDWDNARAAATLSGFFFCFMLARLVLGPVTDRLGFVKSIVAFSAFSAVCTIAAVALGQGAAAVLFALSGAGIAPVYPTVMALLSKRYPRGTDAAITFTVTTIGILGIAGNFVIGGLTDWLGYRAGFLAIGGCALGCAAMGAALYRLLRKQGEVV